MAGGYTTEKSFYVAEGEEGELYVFLKAKNDQPQAPKIIYDGKDHAIFLRNNEQKIILDYIHPDVRDKLRKARQVVIVETILENIKDRLWLPICRWWKISRSIGEKSGLKTWEEVSLGK